MDEVIRYLFRQLGKSERGVTMIEFAIVALLLFALIFGIVEFGWLFFGYITFTAAVREGARMAIIGQTDIEPVIKNHSPAVNLDSESLQLRWGDGAGAQRTLIVSATGEIPLLTGLFSFLSNTDNNTYRLSAEAEMRYESGLIPIQNNNNAD